MWLLYGSCMIVYYCVSQHQTPCLPNLKWFNGPTWKFIIFGMQYNFFQIQQLGNFVSFKTSLNATVGLGLLAIIKAFQIPLLNLFSFLLVNSEIHSDKSWITERGGGAGGSSIVKSNGTQLLIYFFLPFPAHASLVLYLGRDLCIKEFWMTCCVLFHPRSFEGARTGCT